MSKDYPTINLEAVMHNIPTIMGLDLKYYNDAWQGAYYINGERHAYKKDKLKVKLWRGERGCAVWCFEQGGAAMSLQSWLCTYGGAADYKEAYEIMRGNAIPKPELFSDVRKSSTETRYVSREEYEGYKQNELERCNLFTAMCRWFGEERVRKAWERYGVTVDGRGNCVYWYFDTDGRICYDKVIAYNMDGKRNKAFGGTRRFTTAMGHNARPLYGSNLIPNEGNIFVTEGEKTVLILSCIFPDKTFVACGGKNNLRDLDERYILLPDTDAIQEWQNKAGRARVYEWWNGHNVGEKWDIADLLISKVYEGWSMEQMRKLLP